MTQIPIARRLLPLVIVCLAASTAWAQSATCSYDAGTGIVFVNVMGDINASTVDAALTAPASGTIRLNGAPCGAATVTNTDLIRVIGLNDQGEDVTLSGTFRPGRTPEGDGLSEIEIQVDLMATSAEYGLDTLGLLGTGGIDNVYFTAGGVDVGGDGDQDVTILPGTEIVRVLAYGANDYVDALPFAVSSTRLEMYGGSGSDFLRGSSGRDDIHGEGGNDELHGIGGFNLLDGGSGVDRIFGGTGNDEIDGGPGDDVLSGGGGNDEFHQGSVFDGNDDIDGGAGGDVIDYSLRTNPVTVTLGNGLADDGENGVEQDSLVSIESARGGRGDDVLVGTSTRNVLNGNLGNDEIYGEGGNDTLRGQGGNDLLIGDAGDDSLYGGDGADVLDDGEGNGVLWGEEGNDELHGGTGVDTFRGGAGDDVIFNADGVAETVDCGFGIDDPEPTADDTYIGCENI